MTVFSLPHATSQTCPFVAADHHGTVHESSSFAAVPQSSSSVDNITPIRIPIYNNNNLQYYTKLRIPGREGVGEDDKNFNVILDTGSDVLWVPSSACKSAVCKSHHQLSHFKPDGTTSELSYGTGVVKTQNGTATIAIPIIPETSNIIESSFAKPGNPNIAGNEVSSDKSGLTTSQSALLHKYPISAATSMTRKPFSSLASIDGIFGISQKTIFSKKFPPFSIYLSNDTSKNGEVLVGDMHASSPDITWHNTTDRSSWNVELVDFKVNGERMHLCSPNDPCTALVDTGSSLITGPSVDVQKILNRLSPHCGSNQTGGGDTLSLVLRSSDGQEHDYPLTPREYSINFQDTHECQIGIGPLNLGHKKWVIGDTFLRRYLSVYDSTNHRIGFAKSHHQDESVGVITRASVSEPQTALLVTWRRTCARKMGLDFLF